MPYESLLLPAPTPPLHPLPLFSRAVLTSLHASSAAHRCLLPSSTWHPCSSKLSLPAIAVDPRPSAHRHSPPAPQPAASPFHPVHARSPTARPSSPRKTKQLLLLYWVCHGI